MAATYTKLKTGDWGVRVEGIKTFASGDPVEVRKKDGTSKIERVARVVWSGNGVTLVAIQQGGGQTTGSSGRPIQYVRKSGSSGGRRTGCSCGSVEGRTRSSDCFGCRHDA